MEKEKTPATYAGMGGLWLKNNITARSSAPRWSGSFVCDHCGTKNNIVGYGSDQSKSNSAKAPTISLRINKQPENKKE